MRKVHDSFTLDYWMILQVCELWALQISACSLLQCQHAGDCSIWGWAGEGEKKKCPNQSCRAGDKQRPCCSGFNWTQIHGWRSSQRFLPVSVSPFDCLFTQLCHPYSLNIFSLFIYLWFWFWPPQIKDGGARALYHILYQHHKHKCICLIIKLLTFSSLPPAAK